MGVSSSRKQTLARLERLTNQQKTETSAVWKIGREVTPWSTQNAQNYLGCDETYAVLVLSKSRNEGLDR